MRSNPIHLLLVDTSGVTLCGLPRCYSRGPYYYGYLAWALSPSIWEWSLMGPRFFTAECLKCEALKPAAAAFLAMTLGPR